MTAQIREKLIYNGEEYYMATEPLQPYLEEKKIVFDYLSTACWRGYVGEWVVEDNKLYLINLEANILREKQESSKEYETVGLEYLFPNEKKVFAKWFTGVISIPYGKMLIYIHSDYASIYEKELYLEFVSGILVSSHEKDNNKEDLEEHSFVDFWKDFLDEKNMRKD